MRSDRNMPAAACAPCRWLNALQLKCVSLLTAASLMATGCTSNFSALQVCTADVAALPSAALLSGILGSNALLSLDFSHCEDGDQVRAFLTDGTIDGDTELFEGAIADGTFDLTSRSGAARITGDVAGGAATGQVTLADGQPRQFHALPAGEGAGTFEISVDPDGIWTGIGPAGATIEARQQGNAVFGILSDSAGVQHDYVVNDLTRVFNELALGGQPDSYYVIVLPRGEAQLGRGGAERITRGDSNDSPNIIQLDIPLSDAQPGTFVGRFRDLPDLIGFEFDEPDAAGLRHLRGLMTNALEPPANRAEWFSTDFTGEAPDAAVVLTSISGQVKIRNLQAHQATDWVAPAARNARAISPPLDVVQCGTRCIRAGRRCICLFGLSGDAELPDGSIHPFYVVPAGEGAGIYEVQLNATGMHGTSVKGNSISLVADGERAIGAITTPNGEVFSYQADSFGGAFASDSRAAETFVLLVTPRGRQIVGNPGNVHGALISVEMMFVAVVLILGVVGGLTAIRPQRPPPAPTGPRGAPGTPGGRR